MMRRRREQGGQSILEFVVIFPILMLFLFSFVDVGVAMSRRATLNHAVREGARYAATLDNSDGGDFVRNRTSAQSQNLVPAGDVTICYEDTNGSGDVDRGDAVDVTAPYIYKPFILRVALGWFGVGFADVDMSATGSARMEVNASGATC
jgi:Flp pilus assembly protein TadG